MNNIKKFRISLGLTVRQLSVKSNLAAGYISDLENDCSGSTNPSKDVMERISDTLQSTVPDVFYDESIGRD